MCFVVTGTQVEPSGRNHLGPGRGTERAVRCGGCGKAYEHPAWLALSIVGTLTGDAIAAHVVKWPHGVCIEIRRCARCGRSIARNVSVRGEPELPSR
jgi:hypothetical protein